MIVLYAVTRAGSRAPVELDVFEGSRTAVLFAEREAPPSYQRDDVVAFARTLLELDEMLPMRYGTTLHERVELPQLLAANEQVWLDQLTRLHGHVEVIVHWELPSETAAGEVTGRSYLLQRVDHARRARSLAAELPLALPGLVTDVRLLKGDPVRVACLVPRSCVEQFQVALNDWADARVGSLSTTGPWPPFSFAEPQEKAS